MATLPAKMLVHSALLKVPSGVTVWQTPTAGVDIKLERVCVQRNSGIKVDRLNTEVQTHAVLFFDAHLSRPAHIDLCAIKESAEANDAALAIVYHGHTYTVSRVVELLDGYGRVHHYEVEMV